MTTILVTGCAGFIGSNFVNIYLKKFPKDGVVGIDDFSTGKKENVNKNINFYKGSILDKRFLDKIFKKHKIDYLFHFAALPSVSFSIENPYHSSLVNTLGTVHLLEFSHHYKVKRFVFSSSAAIYGNSKKLPIKELFNQAKPLSTYALQKHSAENFCQLFSNLYNLDTVCLRYFNVYGPGQFGGSAYSTVISAWLEALYYPKNKKGFIEGNGKQTRDFCYVDDIVNANLLAIKAKRKLNGQVINIASGKKTSLNQIKNIIEQQTGKKLQLEKRPERIGDVKNSVADTKLAKKLLNFQTKTSLQKGISKTITWFKNR